MARLTIRGPQYRRQRSAEPPRAACRKWAALTWSDHSYRPTPSAHQRSLHPAMCTGPQNHVAARSAPTMCTPSSRAFVPPTSPPYDLRCRSPRYPLVSNRLLTRAHARLVSIRRQHTEGTGSSGTYVVRAPAVCERVVIFQFRPERETSACATGGVLPIQLFCIR